jgi:hypothetical protein
MHSSTLYLSSVSLFKEHKLSILVDDNLVSTIDVENSKDCIESTCSL